MEDAATAEISRAQLWQWVHHNALREDGIRITTETVDSVIEEERRNSAYSAPSRVDAYCRAIDLTRELVGASKFPDFLTTAGYSRILKEGF